jgi:DNA-binding HxlR family transcriptional regulator
VAKPAMLPLQARLREAKQDENSQASIGHELGSAIPNFDRIIHERMRLGIVSALAVSESLTFNDLKRLLRTTDGNLSVHARRLEDAEYIECSKSFEGRLPRTEYRLTTAGRQAFERYLDHMEALIHAMRER